VENEDMDSGQTTTGHHFSGNFHPFLSFFFFLESESVEIVALGSSAFPTSGDHRSQLIAQGFAENSLLGKLPCHH
jgi:hypothetical protein